MLTKSERHGLTVNLKENLGNERSKGKMTWFIPLKKATSINKDFLDAKRMPFKLVC